MGRFFVFLSVLTISEVFRVRFYKFYQIVYWYIVFLLVYPVQQQILLYRWYGLFVHSSIYQLSYSLYLLFVCRLRALYQRSVRLVMSLGRVFLFLIYLLVMILMFLLRIWSSLKSKYLSASVLAAATSYDSLPLCFTIKRGICISSKNILCSLSLMVRALILFFFD